jgi:hypothetical protein
VSSGLQTGNDGGGAPLARHEEALMARDPDELDTPDVAEELDEEAVVDEVPSEHALANGPGLGVDLPEADALDQWREVPLGDEDEVR